MAVDDEFSPRQRFQIGYFRLAPYNLDSPDVLNVGCADDPFRFGRAAMHVDVDDWSAHHRHFRQANAERLPFKDRSYHTVIMGDVLEHVVDWRRAIRECCRVCAKRFVLTIFEEWRLKQRGQNILLAQRLGDEESRLQGAADREDWQRQHFPQRVGVSDYAIPHLVHINQFSDEDIEEVCAIIKEAGLVVLVNTKEREGEYNGHTFYNWLIMAEREGPDA